MIHKQTMTYIINKPSATLDINEIRNNNTLPWNREYLSMNEGITMKDVLELPLPNAIGKWNFKFLSKVLSMQDIKEHRFYEWDRDNILENKNFDMSIVDIEFPNITSDWNWEKVSRKATLEIVRLYPHYKWMKSILILGCYFNIDMVYINMPNAIDDWSWELISQSVTMDVVLEHKELPWMRDYLSEHNRHFCIEMLDIDLPNATGEWNMKQLSLKQDYELIMKYPLLKWDRSAMSYYNSSPFDSRLLDLDLPNAVGNWYLYYISEKIDMEYVRKHPDKPWNRNSLSCNERFSLDIVNLYMPNAIDEWNWTPISRRVTYEELLENPTLPWDRYGLSQSKSIQQNIVEVLKLDLPNAIDVWNKRILENLLTIDMLGDMKYSHIPIEYFNNIIKRSLCISDDDEYGDALNWVNISKTIPMNMIIRYPFLPWIRDIIERRNDLDFRLLDIDMPRTKGKWFWGHLSYRIPYIDILRYPEMICKLGIQDIMKRELSINALLALEFYETKNDRNKIVNLFMYDKAKYYDVTFMHECND